MRRANPNPSRSSSRIFAAFGAAFLLCLSTAPSSVAGPPHPQQSSGTSSAAPSTSASSTTAKKKTSKTSKKRRSKREPTQKAPTPERISEIQSALSRRGYYQGQPNGKWDANTVNAMQKFQSENGLDANGKINAVSLQKLGLGSEIAGVSAPKTSAPGPAPATPVQQPQTKPAPPAPPTPPPSATSSAAKPPA
jgi:peptidoglycan hydrolase-like protein with peptidoglycan-binding domain